MRYVLYDYDAGDLATTMVYTDLDEAKQDAMDLDNVMVVALPLDDEAPGPREVYDLKIGGPEFQAQRSFLLRLRAVVPSPEDAELLEGLINLTDAIADQAADRYGVDCLLPEAPAPGPLPLAAEYVARGGGFCPACRSDQIEGGSVNFDGTRCEQRMTCFACSAVWFDSYTLASVQPREESGANSQTPPPSPKAAFAAISEIVHALYADRETGELSGENTLAAKSACDFLDAVTDSLDRHGFTPDRARQ
jgi:hypothetical protein